MIAHGVEPGRQGDRTQGMGCWSILGHVWRKVEVRVDVKTVGVGIVRSVGGRSLRGQEGNDTRCDIGRGVSRTVLQPKKSISDSCHHDKRRLYLHK